MYLDSEQGQPDGCHITLSPDLQNAGLQHAKAFSSFFFFKKRFGMYYTGSGFWQQHHAALKSRNYLKVQGDITLKYLCVCMVSAF